MHFKLKNRICWPHKLWSKIASWAQCSWGQLSSVLLLLRSVTSEGPLCHMVLCLGWARFPCSLPPREPAQAHVCQCLTTAPRQPSPTFFSFSICWNSGKHYILATPSGLKRLSGLLCPSRAWQTAPSLVQQYCHSLLRAITAYQVVRIHIIHKGKKVYTNIYSGICWKSCLATTEALFLSRDEGC